MKCRAPLLQADVEGRLKELRHFRAGVADENVERTELATRLVDHGGDLVGARHVGLNGKSIGAVFANRAQRLVGRLGVVEVVDGDACSARRQLLGDATTDST